MTKRLTRRGFTLIEVIGVLAIMAILAAAILPSLSQQIRRAYADSEDKSLESIADALKQSIQSRRLVQTGTGWDDSLALFLDVPASSIARSRGQGTRRLIVRPNSGLTWTGTVYNQSTAFASGISPVGSLPTTQPMQARLMIVGDVSAPVSNAVLTAAEFDSVWNRSATAPLAFRETEQLRIARINLVNQFVPVMLNILASAAWNGSMDVDQQWALLQEEHRFQYSSLKRSWDLAISNASGLVDPFGGAWDEVRGQVDECGNSADCNDLYDLNLGYPNPKTCPGASGGSRVCYCNGILCSTIIPASSSSGTSSGVVSSSGGGGGGGPVPLIPSWSIDGATRRNLPMGNYIVWVFSGTQVNLFTEGTPAGSLIVTASRSFTFNGSVWSW